MNPLFNEYSGVIKVFNIFMRHIWITLWVISVFIPTTTEALSFDWINNDANIIKNSIVDFGISDKRIENSENIVGFNAINLADWLVTHVEQSLSF